MTKQQLRPGDQAMYDNKLVTIIGQCKNRLYDVNDVVANKRICGIAKSSLRQVNKEQDLYPEIGLKYDEDKPDYTMVTRELMDAVSRAMMYGAKKYNRDNYKLFTSADIVRFQAALLRHMMAYTSGEELDPESGLSHLDHVGSTLNILLWIKGNKGE
jgi:hypothetical protein